MLWFAVHSRVPIITATTSDTVNIAHYLMASFGVCYPFQGKINSDRLYYCFDSPLLSQTKIAAPWSNFIELSRSLEGEGSSLLVINPSNSIQEAFDVGEVVFQPEYILSTLKKMFPDVFEEEEDAKWKFAVRGLTAKQAIDIFKFARHSYSHLSAVSAFRKARSKIIGHRKGLFEVPVEQDFYYVEPHIEEWIALNRPFFKQKVDHRLVPRGLLFSGPPGVGKSMAAKRIAAEMDVPLYRLDLAASLSKWHGESEANLAKSLAVIDQEEPCVLLIDEVEKIFSSSADEVSSRLLSQLLWWLQEHDSRVLTVMTTNDLEALPKEIYRKGRVDRTISIQVLGDGEAQLLARTLLDTFPMGQAQRKKILAAVEKTLGDSALGLAHADVVQLVYEHIKKEKFDKLKNL
jgi:hypothetical protein